MDWRAIFSCSRDHHSGTDVSATFIACSLSDQVSSSSAAREKMALRSASGVLDQLGSAACAVASACSISTAPDCWAGCTAPFRGCVTVYVDRIDASSLLSPTKLVTGFSVDHTRRTPREGMEAAGILVRRNGRRVRAARIVL